MNAGPAVTETATITVDAQMTGTNLSAQLVRFNIPAPTDALIATVPHYQINMCLTPRPLNARACYRQRWGPNRFERLGDIFMVPPGERLQFRGGSGRQLSIVCQISPALIAAIIGQEPEWSDAQLAATLDITNARIRALLFRLTEEVRYPGYASEIMFEHLGGELAIELARLYLGNEEQPATGGLAGWRLRLIDERLSEDPAAPSLSELAQHCNMSVRQLTRGFKVSRGCSIGDYIEQRRMETAKRLLVDGESVKTIAFAMGFSSPSSFTYAFRRAVGISPSQFRQRQTRGLQAA
ncbi:MAG: helix-turn-helix transcriptional regulator [Novosphingobium sp.]